MSWSMIYSQIIFMRKFITAMDLTEGFHRQGLALLNIKILLTFVMFIGVFASLLSITSSVELIVCACFISVVLILHCSNPSSCYV